jgi:hypothetical protein
VAGCSVNHLIMSVHSTGAGLKQDCEYMDTGAEFWQYWFLFSIY